MENLISLYPELNTFAILSVVGTFIYEDLNSRLGPALINTILLIKDIVHKFKGGKTVLETIVIHSRVSEISPDKIHQQADNII
jgi:hypothetical protein